MSNVDTTKASNESAPFNVRFALDYLDDELEKLLSMAIALANTLEPRDPKDPQDSENVIAWRLAQVLQERLSEQGFRKSMGDLLLGSQS